MDLATKPQFEIAKKVLPSELLKLLTLIFSEGLGGCMLVGGTALAGFYAGHRQSDDLDLFTASSDWQKATILNVQMFKKGLSKLDVEFLDEFHSKNYFRATCRLNQHNFKIDVVEDKNLFNVGQAIEIQHKIRVADLPTLLMMKAATLVSRCSEKDLFDILWILKNIEGIDLAKLIESGKKIDRGLNAEALLISISTTKLEKEACGFCHNQSAEKIYHQIKNFQKLLQKNLIHFLRKQKPTDLSALIKKTKKVLG